jgi:hypothetical protein
MEKNNPSENLKHDLRHLFLREFVLGVAAQIKPSPLPEIPPETPAKPENISDQEFGEKHILQQPKPGMPAVPDKRTKIVSYAPNVMLKEKPTINHMNSRETSSQMRPSPSLKQIPRPQHIQKKSPAIPRVILPPEVPNLGKLNFLLKDSRINAIECPGPGKNILVKRDGATQATQVSLEDEEIKNILDEFSTKTRIPVIGGLFKSAFGNMILSAVLSEFVGTRFMIQRKNQFMPLLSR